MILITDQSQQQAKTAGSEPAALRFGLRSLFITVTVVAVFCGAIKTAGLGGLFAVLAALCLVAGVWAVKKGQRTIITLAMPSAFLSFILALLFPAVENAREAARHSACRGRLAQLGMSIQLYHSKMRRLPPIYTLDENGNPLHSWRTLLLPYIESSPLFGQINLKDAWNAPSNLPLTQMPLPFYRCESDKKSLPHHTNYVAVVGPDTVWRAGRGVTHAEIVDGLADTILLVEMKKSGIPWAEPRDLDLANLPPAIKKNDLIESLSNHPQGLNVAFCDGHYETLPNTIPLDQFEALLTKSGGEIVERDRW